MTLKTLRYCALGIAQCALLLAATGCKPTENNYKAAYDAALAKRAEVADEQLRPSTGLLSDDGPQLKVVGADSVYVLREPLRDLDGNPIIGKWAVVVGSYKMDTNAKAATADIRGAGFPDAMVAKAMAGKFYSIADTLNNMQDAVEASKKFMTAFPDYPYVGLPGRPVLVSR